MSTATASTASTASTATIVFSKIKFASDERIYLDIEDNAEYANCAYAQSYTEGRKGACNYCACQYYCKQ